MASPPTTIYLFAGDSLTTGLHGADCVERVAKGLYRGWAGLDGEAVNASQAGDTVKSLLERIDGPLDLYQPHWVVLAVGGNDVWIPWLADCSFGWWLWSHYHRLRAGQKPTRDLDQFAALYRALIDKVRQAGAQVLACTTPPVGERISSPVNCQLARLNGVIKHTAVECRVPVADVWQAFVERLAPLLKPSGYVPRDWFAVWLDRRRVGQDPSQVQLSHVDELSERRRLQLTFDGQHFNSRGADLWAYTVLAGLALAQGMTAPLESPRSLLSAPAPPQIRRDSATGASQIAGDQA